MWAGIVSLTQELAPGEDYDGGGLHEPRGLLSVFMQQMESSGSTLFKPCFLLHFSHKIQLEGLKYTGRGDAEN